MEVMDRGDGDDSTDNPPPCNTQAAVTPSAATIVVQSLTPQYFNEARQISNEFLGSNKGCCGGILQYAWCPASKSEFENIFRKNPDRCSTYGLAMKLVASTMNDVASSNNNSSNSGNAPVVVGVINMRQGGQPCTWDEGLMYKPKSDELHIEYLAVTKESRGMGAGTKLLEWADEKAQERGANILSLGVVNGNPAKRLYVRKGYEEKGSTCFDVWCFLGMPHGKFGGIHMEKEVS